MPRSTSVESNPEPFFGSRVALILAAAFLAAIALVVALSAWDATRSANLEEFSEVTGVGDTHTFKIPVPPPAVPQPIFTWQGHKYSPVTYKKAKIDDTEM